MSCKMLFFDYREAEEEFFKNNQFDSFDIKFLKESLNELTVCNLSEDDLENTMIISVFSSSKINDNVISKFKNLRVISTRSTGYDHIDINCCIQKNIALVNVDSYGTPAIAQYTLALILTLVRKIYPALLAIKNPLIPKNFCGRDLDVLTLGIIGTGTVGAMLCKYAHSLGMKILAYDINPNKELVENYNVEYIEFEELLKSSDIVTLLIPYTKCDYQKFSYDEFKLMKPGSYFINITRGEFIDAVALLEVARTGKFKGIALDSIACPNAKALDGSLKNVTGESCLETYTPLSELSKLPNVIITPQLAYNTQESVDYILKTTFEGLGEFLQGGRKHRVF